LTEIWEIRSKKMQFGMSVVFRRISERFIGRGFRTANNDRRAAECGELAALATNPTDQEFYLEREHDWLTLARSYELSESVGSLLQELASRKRS
jgi:hypothetical protein